MVVPPLSVSYVSANPSPSVSVVTSTVPLPSVSVPPASTISAIPSLSLSKSK